MSSYAERRAMEAEREVVDLYRAFFMRDRIGEVFEGVIAAVAGFGVFVQIESPFVEGLVSSSALADDYYVYDEQTPAPGRARRPGGSSRSAIASRCAIENVSVPGRKIDFALRRAHRDGAASCREQALRPQGGQAEKRKPPRPVAGATEARAWRASTSSSGRNGRSGRNGAGKPSRGKKGGD